MEAEDRILRWLAGPLPRFQHLTLEPLKLRLEAGEQVGPTWEEVVANDWSLGERPKILSERAKFARIGFDAMSCLRQLDDCAVALRSMARLRQPIPSFSHAELVLIAADAVIYRLLERIASFVGHEAVRGSIKTPIRPPKKLADAKRRRGSFTHQFDEALLETSSTSILLGLVSGASEEDRPKVRSLALAEARRVYRDRIREKAGSLEIISAEALDWVCRVFETTEPAWTRFLREQS